MNYTRNHAAVAVALLILSSASSFGVGIPATLLSNPGAGDVARRMGSYSAPAEGYLSTEFGGGGKILYSSIKDKPVADNPAEATNVSVWCVDSQNWATNNYDASIFRLSDIVANQSLVRYGTLSGGFELQFSGADIGLNNATARYTMAAALIIAYQASSEAVAQTATNRAIQRAIWKLTDTTTDPGPTGLQGADYSTGVVGYNNWIEYAKAKMSFVNQNGWAVISGVLSEGGVLSADNTSSAAQTYLVRIEGVPTQFDSPVPEPGFYGALAIGLSGLLLAVKRRRSV